MASHTANPRPPTASSQTFCPMSMRARVGSHASGPIFMATLLSMVAAYSFSLASTMVTCANACHIKAKTLLTSKEILASMAYPKVYGV